ncbi:MAG: RNA methyltransferase [Chitinophagaceae bacterium]|nr:RNA methyltransferase [Chitinophagaceae bacterium]
MTPERKQRVEAVLASRQKDLTVILENVTDPHNISAVMRTCDAVGIMEIFVITTRVPRHKRWGFRSSSGAWKWVMAHQFDDVAECMSEVRKRYSKIYSTHLAEGAKDLYDLDLTEPVALVFGNEVDGISEETLSYCDGNFIIPQVGIIRSLNISVACAVTIYEAFRQKQAKGHYDKPVLNDAEKASLLDFWKIYNFDQ